MLPINFDIPVSVNFDIPEVLAAYEAITANKNTLYKISARRTLEEIDTLIFYYAERNRELERDLKTYSRHSASSYPPTPQEENFSSSLMPFKYRPLFIAKILLCRETETAEHNEIIKTHLFRLNTILKNLSQANMDLAEQLRQKKNRVPNQPINQLFVEEEEMKILPPQKRTAQGIPNYQKPLNRSVRIDIPQAKTVNNPPLGVVLKTSSVDFSFFEDSLFSPLSSSKATTEILDSTISFDKNASSTG